MAESSTAWKEARRFRAQVLSTQGWTQSQIAEALGVSRGAVCQWLHTVSAEGEAALRARPHTGRPPSLSAAQKALLPDLLSHGAEAYGFRGDVWTCARVAHVIACEWVVQYHPAHVARLLKELHWTPQRPVVRAAQRNETAIAEWRRRRWPELKRQAQLEHKTIVFIDESGFYLLPACVRTYAPCGQTPTLRVKHTRDHLSVMSAITASGALFTLVRASALMSAESVRFLKHVTTQLDRKLLVIWDGSPIHRGALVRAYLADGGSRRIHLEALPPYAPDLNPDEGVWKHLKHVELRNICCADLTHLHHHFNLAVTRIRRKPHLIQSFFAGAGLAL